MNMEFTCPCGKNKTFDACCGRYLSGEEIAKTPEQLMRSRYSAYALGGYGEYLLKTWHPSMVSGLDAESLSKRIYRWNKLEVLEKSQTGDKAVVEFNAFYMDADDKEEILHEISSFQRIKGCWFYVGYEVDT